MKTDWVSNLKSREDQVKFKELLDSSTTVLDRLIEILYNRVKNGELTRLADYESPSWAYRQADQNGYIRAINEVISLLDVSDHET